MNLTNPFAEQTQRVPFLNDALDLILAKINALWNVEHNADGTHNNVTATSVTSPVLTSTASATLEQPIVTTGHVTRTLWGTSGAFNDGILQHQQGTLQVGANGTVIGRIGFWSTSGFVLGVTPAPANSISAPIDGTLSYGSSGFGHRFDGPMFELGRTTGLGYWIAVAFAAGNFTANGAMTWTVDAADQVTFKYALIGKTMFVNIYLDTTTVAGVVNTTLSIAIPGGFVSAVKVQNIMPLFDNGTATSAFVRVDAGGTVINVFRFDTANFAASANNTFVRVMMAFEIQ